MKKKWLKTKLYNVLINEKGQVAELINNNTVQLYHQYTDKNGNRFVLINNKKIFSVELMTQALLIDKSCSIEQIIPCEEWVDIAGYEGLYEVSSWGRVRSLDMKVKNRYGFRISKGRILKPALDGHGYQFVNLYKDGKVKKHKVHRLAAQAFLPNPQHFKEVNHINEVKTDNKVENLEWCSRIYNINFGSRNERAAKALKGKPNIGVKIALSKRVAQIDKNTNEVLKIWPSTIECERNGFNKGNISQCCQGKRKTHHGHKWQYI